ncbi:glucose PTS transporter transcription antiterminator GlcT [Domibacillus epiphyticus]|uniref:Transcriptional antiterminator n=1 Tax=Domibacillus epiphyticus TaxID=1714355 RepID=A0A1V2AAK5_9BACI|nr:transcription antiterminator [Domibacillus epiphyticus]OMP67997.1 transcriptional antiterminator [Domibacillus epiphyticus]
METFFVKKILNNNVLIATGKDGVEVVLIGRGIGFGRQQGDSIVRDSVEKLFVLTDRSEQEQYKKLLPNIDDKTLKVIIQAVELIRGRVGETLNEHIHVGLTDHLVFAVNRIVRGLGIRNPFLLETKALYPFEYEVAEEVTKLINQSLTVALPPGETGFIALHIHSAIANKDVRDVSRHSELIAALIQMIETQLDVELDKESIDYMRLVRHIRYTIERVVRGEKVEEPDKIASLLKAEYPVCYNLSWKLIKVMQQTLKNPVYDAEAVYLTMHLQRIQTKMK